MNEMIKNLGERMVVKMRIVNRVKRDGDYAGNIRECPFYSEFIGMTQALKAMGINFEVEYDEDVKDMTAVVIMGIRFDV